MFKTYKSSSTCSLVRLEGAFVVISYIYALTPLFPLSSLLIFLDPVKRWAKMTAGQPDTITEEEIEGIFGGIPALLEVNRTMLTALQVSLTILAHLAQRPKTTECYAEQPLSRMRTSRRSTLALCSCR